MTKILDTTIYLITPPFTQLNTPYPATAYLKGFLNRKNISSFQSDLGIEVINELFSKNGLISLFDEINKLNTGHQSENVQRIIVLQEHYKRTIETVVEFLQGKDNSSAHLIAGRNFLPEASRFNQLDDLAWAFGSMGIADKAKFLATMYLEDISDLIKE